MPSPSSLVLLSAALDISTVPPAILVAAGVALILLLILLIFTLIVIRRARGLHAASARGRLISAEQSGSHPLTNFTRDGVPSDPLNVEIIGAASQLGTAFAAAGWYRADEIDLITSLRITIDVILKRKYATAPVSNLYLFGRRQDYAFERPGTSVRERDHVRFWDTGQRFKDGRAIWIGGATRDSAVEISPVTHLPTHRIAPDVDAERAVVTNDLISTGWVIDKEWAPGFGKPIQTHNAMHDPYYTDGRRAVLE
ncbi:MAG: LssY C-terminal domain-containing protein, partial [Ktedonobacterales bacterium]